MREVSPAMEGDWMKKVRILVLLLVITFFVFPVWIHAEETSFPDVDMYEEQIEFLAEEGILKGYLDGEFKPNKAVTRLQAVQMILNEKGIDPETTNAPNPNFTDINKGDYGYQEVAIAADRNIIYGKQDGTFDPMGTVTRGQMAAILVNAYNISGEYAVPFYDVNKGVWPYEAVSKLVANGIAKGYPDNTFKPNNLLTRQHFALFLAKTINDEFKDEVQLNLYKKNPHYMYEYHHYEGTSTYVFDGVHADKNRWKVTKEYVEQKSSYRNEWETENGLFSLNHEGRVIQKLKYPVKVGQTWERNDRQCVITSISETITTPAGTFEDLVEVKIGDNMYLYFAKGIGLVSRVEKGNVEIIWTTLANYSPLNIR